jgi:hypothetical protein
MNSEKHSRNNTVSTEKQYYFPGETALLPRRNSITSPGKQCCFPGETVLFLKAYLTVSTGIAMEN